MTHQLPTLAFPYNALEPFIDAQTMEIHHSKHHQAYVDNLNKALPGTGYEEQSLENILANISKLTPAIRNNGGGHFNHTYFWHILAAPTNASIPADLQAAIEKAFGSVDEFKKKFAEAATSRFGSGWAWLIVKDNHELAIVSTPNQDNPLMDIAEVKGTPVLALDVWEHAYYLKYQNKRADYITAFWNVVNWEAVAKHYSTAVAK
ncbi:Fe-Mn family superoxide dismutase [Chitinophaga skermanii]|uniref:Superoxide dismutase n=1 Tax=Chitinophaga skermanii TaxID=331697 RepID=A0A327QGG6_9BACT|nr:superoxide dismutase [Chitinophaga skermanii]RAJ02413.1 Fe-Mn family superoxide dismutase [Chitinophaga skermanii]